jgi:hypothetical protein
MRFRAEVEPPEPMKGLEVPRSCWKHWGVANARR